MYIATYWDESNHHYLCLNNDVASIKAIREHSDKCQLTLTTALFSVSITGNFPSGNSSTLRLSLCFNASS